MANRGSNATKLKLVLTSLALPQHDFAALLAAALRGDAWQSGAVTTAPLMAHISQFIVAHNQTGAGLSRSIPSLLLARYQGFGVEATNLRVRPVVPLPPGYQLPDLDVPDQPQGGDNDDDESRRLRLGLGIGLGVGGGLLVLAAVVVFVVLSGCGRTRSKQADRR